MSEENPREVLLRNHITKNAIGVEVGSWMGEYAESILKITNPEKLYLVDPWTAHKSNYTYKDSMWEIKTQEEMDEKYEGVLRRFNDRPEVKVIRKTSVEAAKDFEDDSIDFVYIDGDHSYESVVQDFDAWFPKVKVGGKIFGDDYHISSDWKHGVIDAVHKNIYDKCLKLVAVYKNQYCLVKMQPYEKNYK